MMKRVSSYIKGKYVYLYPAVDKLGDTIDFMLAVKRDKKAVGRFFKKCIGQNGFPKKITMDESGANKAGADFINLLRLIRSMPKLPLGEIRRNKICDLIQ